MKMRVGCISRREVVILREGMALYGFYTVCTGCSMAQSTSYQYPVTVNKSKQFGSLVMLKIVVDTGCRQVV
jgi:hypothetical protein